MMNINHNKDTAAAAVDRAGGQQQQSAAAVATGTTGKLDKNAPITITRRIQVKIQGSMTDFAHDGQGCATWRCMEGLEPVMWGLQV